MAQETSVPAGHPDSPAPFESALPSSHGKTSFWTLALGSVGVVYGDIGTSPLYAFREALQTARADGIITPEEVYGVASLIIWALTLIVTTKYVTIVLRMDNNGEGGTLSLMALARKATGGSFAILALGALGAALFYGDAVITPAISVLLGRRGPQARHACVRSVHPADHAGHHRDDVPGPEPRHREGGDVLRPDHGHVLPDDRSGRTASHLARARRLPRAQSLLRRALPYQSWARRDARPRRGVPRRDRRGGPVRRSRTFRPQADPEGLVGAGLSVPDPELFRPGSPRPAQPGRRLRSVLPPGAGMGAPAPRAPRHGCDRDRRAGQHHRRVLAVAAGRATRSPAPPGDPSHIRIAFWPDLSAADQQHADGRCAGARAPVQVVERHRVGLRDRGDRHDDHHWVHELPGGAARVGMEHAAGLADHPALRGARTDVPGCEPPQGARGAATCRCCWRPSCSSSWAPG